MTIMLPGMPATYGMPPMGMSMGMMPGMPGTYGMPGAYGSPVMISSLAQLPPGAIPMSQHQLAQALGQGNVGAQVVQEHGSSTIGTVLKGAGIGAAAGAAFGVIPFLPLGLFSGALVGAGVGAAIGLVRALTSRKDDVPHTMTAEQQQAQVMAQMVGSTPAGARSVAMTAEAPPAAKKVVMGPEMRRRWAAKVRAERAAQEAAAAARK
jgi:hypothetical protein